MQGPIAIDPKYGTKVAYFSMEFAVHQALKTYSGGLGFLAGSHMRSVFDLKQNVVGIGILWSYGYYDQGRKEDRSMNVTFRRKYYSFLEDTGITIDVAINGTTVKVKSYRLAPETFGSAPLYFLSTDIPENDFLARTITHKLYDSHEETRIAQEIVLGIGGAKLLDALGETPQIYHMNEGHSLPMAYYLYKKHGGVAGVKERLVFTTHTPEVAGNEEHDIHLLHRMGFFDGLTLEEVRQATGYREDETRFSLTIGALRLAKIANGVSKIHQEVATKMWAEYKDVCPIIGITNAQNRKFWSDKLLIKAHEEQEDYELVARKKHLKRRLFDIVANQTGDLFDPEVLTIVWARRFAEYKRPGLLKQDFERFKGLVTHSERPVQVIWAGKPYPTDYGAVNLFNELVYMAREFPRVAVLVGYEIELSRALKLGADVWINTPRITREASGTSGMSACMNGAVQFSVADGWHPEFAQHGINAFTIPPCDPSLPNEEQDRLDNQHMLDILEKEIIPLYYGDPKTWTTMMKRSITSVLPYFDTGRMANEYYEKMYNYNPNKN